MIRLLAETLKSLTVLESLGCWSTAFSFLDDVTEISDILTSQRGSSRRSV